MAAREEIDLDAEGITVCAIGGVHFGPYVRLMRALRTPHAVITDGDPRGRKHRTGKRRMQLLAIKLAAEGAEPAEHGLFHGQQTLELDLYDADGVNEQAMLEALDHFTRCTDRERELQEAPNEDRVDGERLMVFIEAVDKGRFAQRLASDLEQLVPPRYVRDALEHLAEACAG